MKDHLVDLLSKLGPEFPGGHGKKKNALVNILYSQTRGSIATS